MIRTMICGLVFLCVIGLGHSVSGDVAPPPSIEPLQVVHDATPVRVTISRDTEYSRLIIPAKFLKNARGRIPSIWRILAALTALVLTFTGAFVLKPEENSHRRARLCSGVGITLGIAVAIWGMLPLGPGELAEEYQAGTIEVALEVTPAGEQIQMIVHPEERKHLPTRWVR